MNVKTNSYIQRKKIFRKNETVILSINQKILNNLVPIGNKQKKSSFLIYVKLLHNYVCTFVDCKFITHTLKIAYSFIHIYIHNDARTFNIP